MERGRRSGLDTVINTHTVFFLYKHIFGVGESVPTIGATSMALLSGQVRKHQINVCYVFTVLEAAHGVEQGGEQHSHSVTHFSLGRLS